jgi:hypothetical protein
MVARVRPSLDPFQCARPEIYSGMAPIMAHLHACHNSETPRFGLPLGLRPTPPSPFEVPPSPTADQVLAV